MKNENPRILWIVISFAWRLLDLFEKCTENENFQIFKFTVFTIFSLQKHEIYQKPSKFYFFVLYDITYIQNTSNGKQLFELAYKL